MGRQVTYTHTEWQPHSTYKGWTIEHRPTLKRRGWCIRNGKRKQVFNSLEKCRTTIDKRTA